MNIQIFYGGIEVIFILGGVITTIVFFIAKYKDAKSGVNSQIRMDAMDDLKTTVEALKTQNDLQAGQITTATKEQKLLTAQVANLTGKVDTLSTIPLAKIEQHMNDTNKILQLLIPLIPNATTQHTITESTITNNQG